MAIPRCSEDDTAAVRRDIDADVRMPAYRYIQCIRRRCALTATARNHYDHTNQQNYQCRSSGGLQQHD
jgi:hypothetical protein